MPVYNGRTTTTARLRVTPGRLRELVGDRNRRLLAQDLGLGSTGLVGHLLSGRRTSCTPELAHKLAEILGVAFGDLFVLVAPPVEHRTVPLRGSREPAA